MLTSDELKFFTDNKDKIYDLIRAVNQHEHIRDIVGPGNVIGHPHFVPDYLRSHDLMSRLSYDLNSRGQLGVVGPLDDHQDVPKRIAFNILTAHSC